MSYHCKKCNATLPETTFSKTEKRSIGELMYQNKKIFALDAIHKIRKQELSEAKSIMMHLNTSYGECVRCGYTKLNQENMECPNCQSFNYNWKIEPLADTIPE